MSDNERIKQLERALWSVVAYDQLLRTITTTDMLFAGDAPNVDAAYDEMVRDVTNALARNHAAGAS